MPFNKIQPEQIQLATFFSSSGDISVNQTETGVGLNLSREVSTKKKYLWKNPTETDFDVRKRYSDKLNKLRIVAIDFGIKKSILNRLVSHGCEISVLPSQSTLRDVLSGSSKIMIDQNSGNGVVPYLPLNELNKNKQGGNN